MLNSWCAHTLIPMAQFRSSKMTGKNKQCIIVQKLAVNYFRKVIISSVFRKGHIDGDNHGILVKFIREVKKNKNGKTTKTREVQNNVITQFFKPRKKWTKTQSLSFLVLNARGINTYKKRIKRFEWLRTQNLILYVFNRHIL